MILMSSGRLSSEIRSASCTSAALCSELARSTSGKCCLNASGVAKQLKLTADRPKPCPDPAVHSPAAQDRGQAVHGQTLDSALGGDLLQGERMRCALNGLEDGQPLFKRSRAGGLADFS